MPGISLKSVVGPRSGSRAALQALIATLGGEVAIADSQGRPLIGQDADPGSESGVPVLHENVQLGLVTGSQAPAQAIALLLSHLAAREAEGRAMAAEVLHLYREIHLIEELSEQLAPLLDEEAIAKAALDQAQRLIAASRGVVLLMDRPGESLRTVSRFGDEVAESAAAIGPQSSIAASVLERGVAEIVNGSITEPLAQNGHSANRAILAAPLRAGERTVGLIALTQTDDDAHYSSADLKLLNTISLQAATAMEKARLFSDIVSAERQRAEFAAELKAASAVQQLLLQSASRPTPGFQIESVYLPAKEAGGDFFFVQPTADGSITAIVGDVAGKGLTAAMRVAMILGVLRRETSEDPAEILFHLNNALVAQGQLGFTTACCLRIAPTGMFVLANAGHISPYIAGEEISSAPALPLGLVPDSTYGTLQGRLPSGKWLVLMSDGVPEARSASGQLLGFDQLVPLSRLTAHAIADAACRFGQEDDITVLTIAQV
ncbi:MAG TPA: SpoIIE family protein phosphatase [Acidobacteriaceae bacterium]|jgi:serine phosphatase RsbU (regulator of sigma subunit)|nr:SpoIIE family protein phosphatase [Acidobacteriaceae bacterium]